MNPQPERTKVIIFGIIGLIAFFFILVFAGVIPGLRNDGSSGTTKGASLTFWGIDDQRAFQAAIESFSTANQGSKINYRQFPEKNYESELINAMAAGTGPDIFMFRSSWLPKHGNKTTYSRSISALQVDQLFPKTVRQDFTSENAVYALPLSLDSLALFYNEDFFNTNAIALSPRTWTDFKNLVTKLTQYGANNQILKSAAAIGGSQKSISTAGDLLSLLMLQNGSEIYDRQSKRVFFGTKEATSINFYTQFANPGSEYYTWDENLGNYLDAFSQGKTAMIFGYAKDAEKIRAKNPLLNFKIAPMPQFDAENPVNYANYWGLAVSTKSQNQDLAWNFIINLTTSPDNSKTYLSAAKNPPALKVLINQYINDADLNVFARQALTAKSWYQIDSAKSGQIFSDMIESILSNKLTPPRALEKAAAELNQL